MEIAKRLLYRDLQRPIWKPNMTIYGSASTPLEKGWYEIYLCSWQGKIWI